MAYIQVGVTVYVFLICKAKVVLCKLLPRYKFTHVPGHNATYDGHYITLRSPTGMLMFVEYAK